MKRPRLVRSGLVYCCKLANYAFGSGLYQTEDKRISFDKHVLIKKLSDKLSGLNVTVLRSDVSPFLKDKTELRFIEKDALQTIINNIL